MSTRPALCEDVAVTAATGASPPSMPWWRDAVVYQIYVRSFADADGDGIGDLAGIRSRLPYLRDLGVDAVWLTPFYPSPLADGGYDVADYRDVDPRFGTLDDFDDLVGDGPRPRAPRHRRPRPEPHLQRAPVVPGRAGRRPRVSPSGRATSSATAAGPARRRAAQRLGERLRRAGLDPGDRARRPRPVVPAPVRPRAARPRTGSTPRSGPSSRTSCASGSTGAWTASASTWPTAWSRTRGCPTSTARFATGGPAEEGHPHWDQDEVHDVYRAWRRVIDAYPGDRMFVAEAWVHRPHRLARYLRPDELHTAFNFDFLLAPWDGRRAAARSSTTASAALADGRARRPTWVLSNHDVPSATSPATAAGRSGHPTGPGPRRCSCWPCPAAPTSTRARSWACPRCSTCRTTCARTRPSLRTGGLDAGRDGCRVPLPWSGERAAVRLRTLGSSRGSPSPMTGPSSPSPRQAADPTSTLTLYRTALHLRRELASRAAGPLTWLDTAGDVLAFRRGPSFGCVVNVGDRPTEPIAALSGDLDLVVSSAPLDTGGRIPGATTAWYAATGGTARAGGRSETDPVLADRLDP